MLSRFLDWVFPSRVAKRKREAEDARLRKLREENRLKREADNKERDRERERRWNAARESAKPVQQRTQPRAPYNTPRSETVETRRTDEETTAWPFPTSSWDRVVTEPPQESFAGKGGTFDGGGASGDWGDDSSRTSSTSCDAPSYSSSDSSSSSSSYSSSDSGSSYSSSDSSSSSCDSSSSCSSGGCD